MIKFIMENGGIVNFNETKGHYVICQDGSIKNIWTHICSNVIDKLNRKIVHFRWVKACVRNNVIINDFDLLHLLPMP